VGKGGGSTEGEVEGDCVGISVGEVVGAFEGEVVGLSVGEREGLSVGALDGELVGSVVETLGTVEGSMVVALDSQDTSRVPSQIASPPLEQRYSEQDAHE